MEGKGSLTVPHILESECEKTNTLVESDIPVVMR